MGALQNFSFIQRINTKGGVEKTKPCSTLNTGEKLTLPYRLTTFSGARFKEALNKPPGLFSPCNGLYRHGLEAVSYRFRPETAVY